MVFLLLLGCAEEEKSGPQFDVDPVNRPMEVDRIVIVPNSEITSDSFLQCLPTISGADLATLQISYQWNNLTQETVLGEEYSLQLTTAKVRAGDVVECRIFAVDAMDDQAEGAEEIVVAKSNWYMGDMERSWSGERTGDLLGAQIASLGDFNGDSYTDFVFSAPKYSSTHIESGAVYLFTGIGEGLESAHIKIEGEKIKEQLSNASFSGDIDGDGLNDLLFSSVNNDDAGIDAGKVYLYFAETIFSGGQLDPLAADKILLGAQPGELFGSTLLGLGDMNDDGHSEFVVGAPNNDENGYESGRVALYSGRHLKEGSNEPRFVFHGSGAQDHLGYSFGSMKDVDGDGRPEMWITAVGGMSTQAKIYLFYGVQLNQLDLFLTDASMVLVSESPGDFAGHVLESADVNMDGFAELLIGAPYHSDYQYQAGAAYLLSGRQIAQGELSLSEAAVKFNGEYADDRAGSSVGLLQDRTGDGASEVLIASPGASEAQMRSGKVYLMDSEIFVHEGDFARPPVEEESPESTDSGGAESDTAESGSESENTEDNTQEERTQEDSGAQQDDSIPQDERSSQDSSQLEINLGEASIRFLGQQAYDQLGTDMAVLGDIDNDGIEDFLLAAPSSNTNGSDAGTVYLILGGSL